MNQRGLFSSEITKVLEKRLADNFVVVCPVNELILNRHGIYVVNTDCGVGSHWVVINVTEETVEFFDSFGRHPLFVQNGHMFMKAIKTTNKQLLVTSQCYQEKNSYVCGWYCLAYAFVRVKFNSPQMFHNLFTDCQRQNDKLVVLIVNTLYKNIDNVYYYVDDCYL